MTEQQSTPRRVARNTGVIIAGSIIGGLINLFTIALFVRFIGAEQYGIYAFVFAYLGFFAILSDLGINTIVIREISKFPERATKLLGNALSLKLTLSVLAIAVAGVVVFVTIQSASTRALLFLASLSFLFSIGSLYRTALSAHLVMRYAVLGDLIGAGLRCAAYLLFVWLHRSLGWFIMVEVVVGLPLLIMSRAFCHRYIVPDWQIDPGAWMGLLKEAWPLALSTVFVFFYFRIDQLMLYYLKGAAEVGLYAPTVKLTEAMNIIPQAFMISVFPLFSRYVVSSPERLRQSFVLSARLLMSVIIPAATLCLFLSSAIMAAVFGDAFRVSSTTFIILMWAEVFIFAGSVNNRLLIAIGRQRIDFIFTGCAAVLNVVLNFALIPRYGFLGAAVASLLAYAAGPFLNCLVPGIRQYGIRMFQAMVKPLCASCGLFLVVWLLRENLWLGISAGVAAYALLLFLLKGFSRQEMRWFLESIQVERQV